MKMLGDFNLIEPEPWTVKKIGSILLPEGAEIRKRFARGKILETGPGVFQVAKQLSPPFKSGQHVLYYKVAAVTITTGEGQELHIVQEPSIIAILEEGEFGTLETGESNVAISK